MRKLNHMLAYLVAVSALLATPAMASNINVSGTVTAISFTGDGSGLTNLPSGISNRITSGTTGMYTYNNTSATIATAGLERIVVGTSGEVGIGQQPQASMALGISGSMFINSFQAPFQAYRSTDGSIAGFQVSDTLDSTGVSIYGYLNNFATPYLRDTAMIYTGQNTANLQLSAASTTGVIRFTTGGYNSTATERMRIDSNGRVGIGNNNPTSATLEVSGNAIIATNINASSGLGIVNSSNGNASVTGLSLSGDTGSGALNYYGSGWTGGFWASSNTLELAAYASTNVLQFRSSNPNGIIRFMPNSTERMRIMPSGNIGIGTPTPTTLLHVNGTLRIADGGEACDASRLGAIRYTSGNFSVCRSAGTWDILATGAGDSFSDRITSGTLAQFIAETAGTTQISSTGLFINNGGANHTRIELGANSSSNRQAYIDFVGDTTYTDYGLRVLRNSGGPDTGSYIMHRGLGGLFLQTKDAGPIIFTTSNTESMRISPEGYVGIGTDTPASGLSIFGDGGVMDDVNIDASTATATNSGGIFLTRSRGTTAAKTAVLNGDLLGTIRGSGYNGSGNSAGGAINFYAAGDFASTGTRNGDIAFFTTNANSYAERARLTSEGYLGIGTTNPVGPLQILSVPDITSTTAGGSLIIGPNTGAHLRLDNNELQTVGNGAGAVSSFAINPYGGNFTIGSPAATVSSIMAIYGPIRSSDGDIETLPSFSWMGDTNTGIWHPAADTLGFVTGGGEAVRITSTNRVGIGTTAPAVALHVSGTLRVQNGAVVTCNIGTGTGATSCTSDRRLKTDIANLPNSLEKIATLNGVSFKWKSADAPKGKHIGVIAQDVEKVFPEAVETMENGYKTVDYAILVAPLIESVKTLKSENDALKARSSTLEAQNAAILKRLEALEKHP